jgi:2-dehydro-3-deoxygluconokinase
MTRIITFGEIMGRLAPDGLLRFRQAVPGPLTLTFGGAEANVAVSLAQLGADAAFVTALPKHAVADACVAALRGFGVDTRFIQQTDAGRLGLYFLEYGANQRPSQVIYDRDRSAVGIAPADAYPWRSIFEEAGWFHLSGITPAISRTASEAATAAVRQAKLAGATVSCDLNYRKKLWRWEPPLSPRELAERTMREILPYVDLVIANEEDAADILRIEAAETDVAAGKLAAERYPEVARKIVEQFPHVSKVAITLRESVSASHNNWGAMLFDAPSGNAFFAPMRAGRYQPYEIRDIVDRVGGGDAFAAGLIFALTTPELAEPAAAVSFAVAASCLAHSVHGDFNYASRGEVEALMRGSGAGRVVR